MEEALEVYGGTGLVSHLEATADLHRAISLLWEGVGTVLKCSADIPERELNDSRELTVPVSSTADNVRHMIKDQENLDIPMHLEELPFDVSAEALSIDVGRVQASADYLLAEIISAGKRMHGDEESGTKTHSTALSVNTSIVSATEAPVVPPPQLSTPADMNLAPGSLSGLNSEDPDMVDQEGSSPSSAGEMQSVTSSADANSPEMGTEMSHGIPDKDTYSSSKGALPL